MLILVILVPMLIFYYHFLYLILNLFIYLDFINITIFNYDHPQKIIILRG